ncbi:hypothetical protein [Sulfurimonas sp.]|uniref:hypothetical protein n=1 Tax=Sulfurimonas sp. TaxID=2022749 RepID=UPI002AB1ED58|nr:hypothetical protein [Sulfurimonas sp.]
MKIDNIKLYEFLHEKEITHFFHANTLTTSLTFIENNGLMSRGLVEKLGLKQTIQCSDDKDEKFDVWEDIFIDTMDLHGYFPRQNLYGPIVFKFNIEFLLEDKLDIWITKDNPIYWTDKLTMQDKYFQDINDLKVNWDNFDRQKKMFTIKNTSEAILFDFLEKIIVDNPNIELGDETHVFNEVVRELKKILLLKINMKKETVYHHVFVKKII